MLRPRRDAGFTLIELLVSVAVLGIVMGGLGAVIIGAVSTDVKTRVRLDETRAEAFAAVYFGTDAQTATSMVAGGPAGCGTGTAVIEFRGQSYSATTLAATVTVVSYVFNPAAGQLVRQSCEAPGTSTFPLPLNTTTTVARSLATTAPTAVCAPTACSATPNTASTTVTLSVARRSGDAPFQLVGTRRTTT